MIPLLSHPLLPRKRYRGLLILILLVVIALSALLTPSVQRRLKPTGIVQPVISFIGISVGTLATPINQLTFRDRFTVNDRQLVALVSFEQITDGSEVWATWFSPDDRAMPIGRKTVFTQSGATLLRFTIASQDAWKPAPYALRVDAFAPHKPGERPLTATGSTQFFIDMTEREVGEYRAAYAEWKQRKMEEMMREDQREAGQRSGVLALPSRE